MNRSIIRKKQLIKINYNKIQNLLIIHFKKNISDIQNNNQVILCHQKIEIWENYNLINQIKMQLKYVFFN